MTSEKATEEQLAADFLAARSRLLRVAYSMLGSHADAEDVVADCWLKLSARSEVEPIRDVTGWCLVTVARTSIDLMRSARVRREEYVGPWLPEPVVDAGDPADRVTLDDQVSYALLVVLETLSAAERTSFVLHDLFGMPFDEIAALVGRAPVGVRKLASRARRRVRERANRPTVDPMEHRRVVRAFAEAVTSGDLTALVNALDPDVVLVSDGGGAVTSALRPVLGADHVARFVLGIARKGYEDGGVILERTVNGLTGLVAFQGNVVDSVASFAVSGGRITRIDLVRAPAKLPGRSE